MMFFSKPYVFGLLAILLLLSVYFGLLSLLSGFHYALEQYVVFWPYVMSLAVGFGIQIGLYVHLRQAIRNRAMSASVVATTGTTSTLAMVSCCAHYLVNILPVLGVTGFVSFVAQYQTSFFWVGILFNVGGIVYIGRKVYLFHSSSHA